MKNYKAVYSSLLTEKAHENRYVVIDDNHNILDNNKGEGFKSKEKALSHYELKTFKKIQH